MKLSSRWINDYLDRPATPEEQADLLTRVGFPLESREDVAGISTAMAMPGLAAGVDARLDIETTSNRGDCLCHVGMAREIAAVSGRVLKAPSSAPKANGPAASTLVIVKNHEPARCPLFTARVIRGVKVGPSPAWLADRLTARGDQPRNIVVDMANFVLFELGQPTHVFDMAKLARNQTGVVEIHVRRAKPKESFLPIGDRSPTLHLTDDDLVIADLNDAAGIAGVKGGAATAVSNSTTDILIEAATFAPAGIRATGRRLGLPSDAAYRYERGVHAGQIEAAANRLAALILEHCGGTLCEGYAADGQPIPSRRTVAMRPDRCRAVLGVNVPDAKIMDMLARLDLQPRAIAGSRIECTIPYPRIDLEREIDLIEEVARMTGLEAVPVQEVIEVRVPRPQPEVNARRAVQDVLAGMGFVECITHSLIGDDAAARFLPPGMETIRIAHGGTGAEPALRPSIIPSLLRVARDNHHHGTRDVRLFESASVFAHNGGRASERVNLALVASADDAEEAIRTMRGAVDRLVTMLVGPGADITVEPQAHLNWFSASAVVKLQSEVVGVFGILNDGVVKALGIDRSMAAAELGLTPLYAGYPPDVQSKPLPTFPPIERDISAIVPERTTWTDVCAAVDGLRLEALERTEFVTVYRGQRIGAGRKSLSLRLRFRAADRTLRHEEADAATQRVMSLLGERFNAEIRT